MTYIVVNKEDMNMTDAEECDSMVLVQDTILAKIQAGKHPIVMVEVPYKVSIKVEEGKTIEAAKSKTKPDKGPGSESDREIRRGDEEPAEELGTGSGDPGAGPGAKDKR